jgi:DNA-binding MarR family transcriptional regulator
MSAPLANPLIHKAAEIRQAVTRLAQRLRAERPEDGLSTNKLSVLAHLFRNSPATPGDIATAGRHQPQSLTRLLAELEEDGLISRTRSEEDRRQMLLTISDEGRATLIRNMAGRDIWLANAMAGLTELECEILRLAAPVMERLAETGTDLPKRGKTE